MGLAILIQVLFITAVCEFVSYRIFNGYINDAKWYNKILKTKRYGMLYQYGVFYIGGIAIVRCPLSITSGYYISEVGMIPRWTKTNKLVKKLMKETIKKQEEAEDNAERLRNQQTNN